MCRFKSICLALVLFMVVFGKVICQNIAPKFYNGDAGVTKATIISSETSIENMQASNFRVFLVKNVNTARIVNSTNTFIDRNIFVLIDNDLHWLNSTSSQIYSKFVATLSGRGKHVSNTEILEIQGTKWQKYYIFITGTSSSYVVYLLPEQQLRMGVAPIKLLPIQKLSRYGDHKSVSFVELDNIVYCLLGSNLPEENSSFLRIFKWENSFFQVVESHQNNNHQIDDITVDPMQRVIVLMHWGLPNERETSIHIYRYALERNDNEEIPSFHAHRIQEFHVPHDLVKSYLLYSEATGELILDICKSKFFNLNSDVCMSFLWTDTDLGIGNFKEQLEPSVVDKWVKIAAIEDKNDLSNFKIDQDAVFLQYKDAIMAFVRSALRTHSNRTAIQIPCKTESLIHLSLLKLRVYNSSTVSYESICVFKEPLASSPEGFTIRMKQSSFIVLQDDGNLVTSGRNTTNKCAENPNDWRANPAQLRRVKFLLEELKEQLLHRRDQYVVRAKQLLAEIDVKMNRIKQNGSTDQIRDVIAAQGVRLSDTTVAQAIVINGVHDINVTTNNYSTIREAAQKLKEISLKMQQDRDSRLRKRSIGNDISGDTVTVKNLIVPNTNFWKGLPRMQTINSTNIYYFDGQISTGHLEFDRLLFDDSGESFDTVALEEPRLIVETPGRHKEIIVKTINGIVWDDFIASVFLKSNPMSIKGKVHLKKPATIKKLRASRINGIPTENLFTLTTAQTIKSHIYISKFHVGNITANSVNGHERFHEKIVVIGRDNIIESPIRIGSCIVSGDLTLSEREDVKISRHIVGTRMDDLSQIYNGRVLIRGSLKVGNATVGNFDATAQENPFQNVLINGQTFDVTKLHQKYWMKTVDQELNNVIFTEAITTPEVYATTINGHVGNDFLTFDTEPPAEQPKNCLPISLHFQSRVTVKGNVLTDSSIKSILARINEEAIRRFDRTPILLNSPITFTDRLIVNHIAMMFNANEYLHLTSQNSVPFESRLFELRNKQFTNSIHIQHHFMIDNPNNATVLRIANFNDQSNLDAFLKSILLDDRPFDFNGIVVFEDGFGADNLLIGQLIDNHGYEDVRHDHVFNISELFTNILQQENGIIKSMRVQGNVTFTKFPPVYHGHIGSDLLVQTVNGLNVTEYFGLVVPKPGLNEDDPLKHQTAPLIGGVKTFSAGLEITYNLRTPKINERVDVQHWLKNALLKISPEPQFISGATWSFGTLKSNNLIIEGHLNGINMDPNDGDVIFLDTNYDKPIDVYSDIRFTSPNGIWIDQSAFLYGAMKCDLNDVFGSNITIRRSQWKSIDVNGNVNCRLGDNGANGKSNGFLHFFGNAVLTNADQSFYENVTIHLTDPSTGSVTIKQANDWQRSEPLIIDGIPLNNILLDALTSDIDSNETIVIRGQKQFLTDNLKCEGSASVSRILQTEIINQVNLLELNASLIRKDHEFIEFSGGDPFAFEHAPTIEKLIVNGQFINGVPIDDIFMIDASDVRPAPSITFTNQGNQFNRDSNDINKLHVEGSLQLNLVNNISLDHFISTRIRKSPILDAQGRIETQLINGSITFENLVIAGDRSVIHSINQCPLADIVVSNSKETQYITGHKYIAGPLNADGVERGAIFVNSPSVLFNINGIDYSQAYSQSVRRDENIAIKSLGIPNPFSVETAAGLVIREKLNDNDVRANENVAAIHFDDSHVQKWQSMRKDLERVNSMQKKELRYIDRSDVFHVVVSNSQDAGSPDEQLNQLYNTWMTVDVLRAGRSNDDTDVNGQYLCPVQYHIRSVKWPSRNLIVHRERPYSRLMTVSLHPEFLIHVRTEFPPSNVYFHNCNFTKHTNNRPLSTIYINHKVAISSRHDIIESINVFYVPDDTVYMLLHIHRKYIAVLRGSFHQPHDNWKMIQKIPCLNNELHGATIDNTVVNAHLFSWNKNLVLVVANGDPINVFSNQDQVENNLASSRSTVAYHFHLRNERFYRLHEISGDFNIINGMEVITEQPESKFVLMLGKQYSNFLTTWQLSLRPDASELMDETLQVQLHGKLSYDVGIQTISTFTESDVFYMSVVLRDSNYRIYRYREANRQNTSPWQSLIPGYFKDLYALVPFSFNQKMYLLVLANVDSVANGAVNTTSLDSCPIFTLYY